MKLTIFNGSPKGEHSNTKYLLDGFTEGFLDNESNSITLCYLNKVSEIKKQKVAFTDTDIVLIAFPLYHDSMPAIVKNFIENLEDLKGQNKNPSICFFVQSGFYETIHSRFVERYLKKLAKRLGCPYLGSILKGGIEGIKFRNGFRKKVMKSFASLGKVFADKGAFDPKLVQKMTNPEKFSKLVVFIFKILDKTGLTKIMWKKQMKKNGVLNQSFARPFDKK